MNLNKPVAQDHKSAAVPSKVAQRRPNGPTNKPSKLLSEKENEIIFETLGEGRQTLVTAKVTLLTPTIDQRHWQENESGAVCFVRDAKEKSYFIQILCIRKQVTVLKEAVQIDFSYECPQPSFLMFQGKSTQVGLNFADIDEATNFRNVLDKHLQVRRKKRAEREAEKERLAAEEDMRKNAQSPKQIPKNQGKANTWWFSKKPEKPRIRIDEIGAPTGPVYHFGSGMTSVLRKIGIRDAELEDEATRKIIFNYISENGGMVAWEKMFEQESTSDKLSQEVSETALDVYPKEQPLTVQGRASGARKVRPTRPPPTPNRPKSPPPPPKSRPEVPARPATGSPKTPPAPGPPPPPPPPPRLTDVCGAPTSTGANSNDIPVSPPLSRPVEPREVPDVGGNGSADPHNELLKKITGFSIGQLKRVEPQEKKVPQQAEGWTAGLLEVIGNMRLYIKDSDSDSDDHGFSD